jgi:hypothetical protein
MSATTPSAGHIELDNALPRPSHYRASEPMPVVATFASMRASRQDALATARLGSTREVQASVPPGGQRGRAFGCNDRTGWDGTIPQIRLFGSGSRVGTVLSSLILCCPSKLEGRERTSGDDPVIAVP